MKRERKMMQPDVWNKILHSYVIPYRDKNNKCPPTVIPHKDGESLLNKHFPTYLQSIADADHSLKIDIYSHGMLLPKFDNFIPFLGRLPNQVRLMISFHFWNHDGTYNDYGPLQFYLMEMLQQKKIPPNVELILTSHLIAPSTRESLDAWKANWDQFVGHGLSAVHANVNINPWTGTMKEVATCAYDGCPYKYFDHMFFGATGNVVACCLDLNEEIIFGNVMQDDPAEMVEKVGQFYADQEKVKSGELPLTYEVCRDCMGMGKRQDLIQIGGVA